MRAEEVERPALGGALAEYSDKIFARVALREKYKHPMRCEFEGHLEEYSEELLDHGYKPYAAEAVRRMGPPEQIADKFNRMESLRNWFRDHLCTKAVCVAALGYAALSTGIEGINLLLGLSGLDTGLAYDFDQFMYDARPITALFAGVVAYWLYYRWTGNTHRFTPFATLSAGLFVVTMMVACNLNFISPFPDPECRVFLVLDFPAVFSSIPFAARSYVVCEFDLIGLAAAPKWGGFHVAFPPYSADIPFTLAVRYLGLGLAVSFVFERLKQRQFFQNV